MKKNMFCNSKKCILFTIFFFATPLVLDFQDDL